MSCKDQLSSSTLCFEDFNDNEEIDSRMDEACDDESNGYKSYSFNDNKEGCLGRISFNSMNEERNEEWNEKINKERSEEGNERRNSNIWTKDRCLWQGVKCDLVDDVKVFVASGHVTICDSRKVVFDDELGEDHVGPNIFYYSTNISTKMTI